jgi:type III secretion protein V
MVSEAISETSAKTAHATAGESSMDSISLQLFSATGAIPTDMLAEGEKFENLLTMMYDGLFYELGLNVPEVRILPDAQLAVRDFRIVINRGKVVAFNSLAPKTFLVNASPAELKTKLGLDGVSSINPANGNECTEMADDADWKSRCEQAGYTTWSPAGHLILSLSAAIRAHAAVLLSREIVKLNLTTLGQAFPELVAVANQRLGSGLLTQILRELLEEQISIRNLRGILESLVTVQQVVSGDRERFIIFVPTIAPTHVIPVVEQKSVAELSASDYANVARIGMKHYISHKFTRGQSTLIVHLLDPAIEKRLVQSHFEPLTADEIKHLSEAIRKEIETLPPGSDPPPILTTAAIRRRLWDLLHYELPHLRVLSYQELQAELNIQPISRITSDAFVSA